MKAPTPDVSVVLPTFNRRQLVDRAIRSVVAQTLKTIELIVVDDGSTDGTSELIQELRSEDARIVYLYQENQGLASARNIGVTQAAGKYVTFIDSDDEYEGSHLELRREFLESDHNVMMLHGGVRVINGSSMVPDYYLPGAMVDIQSCAVGATFFYRREFHSLVGGFEHREYGEDTEFFEKAIQLGEVRRVDWPTYLYYRDSGDSIVSRTIESLRNHSV
jgi:glycosyltransferase involved in cell wall biosynthesis